MYLRLSYENILLANFAKCIISTLAVMSSSIRRLSTALKLTKAYKPYAAPDVNTFAAYLTSSKEKYLADVRSEPSRGQEWTVAIGNEAGGAFFSP